MRLAIIGAQHGHVLGITRQLIAEDGVELVAVAEAEASVREETAAAFGVPGIEDYRELLDGSIDAAALAPINNEKGDVAVACLEAGVSVLLDKPAVTTLDDLDRLEAAAQGEAALSCALTLRFSGPYLAAKRAIEAGEIGQVVSSMAQRPHKCGPARRPAWFFDRELNGGALLDLCIHDVDAVRWLHGSEPTGVAAQHGATRFRRVPDVCGSRRGVAAAGGRRVGVPAGLVADAGQRAVSRRLPDADRGDRRLHRDPDDGGGLLHDRPWREAADVDRLRGAVAGYANGGRAERAGAGLCCGGAG